jgi:hypothetical protein
MIKLLYLLGLGSHPGLPDLPNSRRYSIEIVPAGSEGLNIRGDAIDDQDLTPNHGLNFLSTLDDHFFLFLAFGQVILDHNQEVIFLNHMVVDGLVVRVRVVNLDQDVI